MADNWGLEVTTLHSGDQLDAAVELLWSVWGARDGAERNEVMTGSLLRTLEHSGNYVGGAFADGELIGCTVAMFGADAAAARPDHLHSMIVGVHPAGSNHGVGTALMRHQRRWALEHGVDVIRWTFDPMVARNAYFNLCKLGAVVKSFEPDFYGRMDNGIDTDQVTDRLLVEWRLHDKWVEQAANGELGNVRRHATVLPGAELIAVPSSFAVLRETDPDRARQERLTARHHFQSLQTRGYTIAGMSTAKEYVLLPPGTTPAYE